MSMSMSMATTAAEPKNADIDIDRISNLPDCLLCHILSFLPTKTSVATCLLSRRWLRVWVNIQVLDFEYNSNKHSIDDLYDEIDKINHFKRFTDFLRSTVVKRRSRIRKLRLSCPHSLVDDHGSVDLCLKICSSRQLEELELILSLDVPEYSITYDIFRHGTKLVSLSITGAIRLRLPTYVKMALPSLKTLQLNIKSSQDSVDVLLSACPILETLTLSFAPSHTTTKICCIPLSLKTFNFMDCHKVVTNLEINTPALKCLSITQNATSPFPLNLHNVDNVDEVSLNIHSVDERVQNSPLILLLQALSGTKHLVLHSLTTQWLFRGPNLDFLVFHNLLHLEINDLWCNPDFLLNLLQKCDMLQVLIICNHQKRSVTRWYCDPPPPPPIWEQPTSVPKCLVSHLTSVHLKGFTGSPDEMTFAAYVLQNGLVLKTVIFSHNLVYGIPNELSSMLKGSRNCQLKFDSIISS